MIKSYAKINLGLKITKKRDDGYHELKTIFQEISLYDEIDVKLCGNSVRLVCEGASLPCDDSNLMVRASKKMLSHAKKECGVFLSLKKKIPVGAGLGGGSSNAATVLKEMNRLLNLGWSSSRLKEIGLELGADVPFFIDGGSSLGEGIGEKLSSLNIPPFWVVLVCPDIHISTVDVYRKINLMLTSKTDYTSIAQSCASRGDLSKLGASLYNDLENTVCLEYPEIIRIKKELKLAGALGALMSGSGSCVFGMFDTRKDCEAAVPSLRELNIDGKLFIVSSVLEERYTEIPLAQ